MGIWKNFDKRRNMHGKNSCSVTLTYNDITSQRTSVPIDLYIPNRMKDSEDNEAQFT